MPIQNIKYQYYGSQRNHIDDPTYSWCVVGETPVIKESSVGEFVNTCREHNIWGVILDSSQAKLIIKAGGRESNQVAELQKLAMKHHGTFFEHPRVEEERSLDGRNYSVMTANLEELPELSIVLRPSELNTEETNKAADTKLPRQMMICEVETLTNGAFEWFALRVSESNGYHGVLHDEDEAALFLNNSMGERDLALQFMEFKDYFQSALIPGVWKSALSRLADPNLTGPDKMPTLSFGNANPKKAYRFVRVRLREEDTPLTPNGNTQA